ncbi:MAG: hypothetical protein FD160_4184 [Caulobacteraceae bacterium]|nr:MAG: hypothetical protein FD160_4184 [Caulobacteraceae bacterium]
MRTNPDDLRRWVAQQRLAEARILQERATHVPEPSAALARGLGWIAFVRRFRPPAQARLQVTSDDIVADEDHVAYARWVRLRKALGIRR